MTNISSYELLEFNIDGHIILDQKRGMIKIMRSEDGRIILAEDSDYGLIDQNNPTQTKIADTDSMLGLVMDIGIKRTKRLTYSGGFYFGSSLVQGQSLKKVGQKDFDSTLMEKIDFRIQKYFVSGDTGKEVQAVKYSNLIRAYNDARLLFTTFYNESYLAFLRILDSLSNGDGSYSLATLGASASHDLNEEIFKKVSAIGAYPERIKIAEETFNDCFAIANKKKYPCAQIMSSFLPSDKFVFSCLYSAYQYRNVFVHQGMPFPSIVIHEVGGEDDSGMAYIHPSVGSSLIKVFRPQGLKEGDSLDIHCIVTDPDDAKAFKERYFLLLPTWRFLKTITRATLLRGIDELV